jgi:multisubunit Na+/H+ antiporter MnhC subunit
MDNQSVKMSLEERKAAADKMRKKLYKDTKDVKNISNATQLQTLMATMSINQNLPDKKIGLQTLIQVVLGYLENANLDNEKKEKIKEVLTRQLTALQNMDKIQKQREISDGDNIESFTISDEELSPDITSEDYQDISLSYEQVLELGRKLNNARNNEFNDLIDKNNSLNQEIFNKDKIIVINEDASNKQERIIMGIKPILILMILMILPIYLMLAGHISRNLGLFVIGGSTLITLIVITVRQIRSYDNVRKSVKRKDIRTAKEFGQSLIQTLVPTSIVKDCPAQCGEPGPERRDKKVTLELNGQSNEVWLDNPINVWKDGQVPTVAGNKAMMDIADEEGYHFRPLPAYGPPKFAKTYTCVYNGNVDKMTDIEKLRGKQFKSKYPCKYWPGYIETTNIPIIDEE